MWNRRSHILIARTGTLIFWKEVRSNWLHFLCLHSDLCGVVLGFCQCIIGTLIIYHWIKMWFISLLGCVLYCDLTSPSKFKINSNCRRLKKVHTYSLLCTINQFILLHTKVLFVFKVFCVWRHEVAAMSVYLWIQVDICTIVEKTKPSLNVVLKYCFKNISFYWPLPFVLRYLKSHQVCWALP